MKLIHNGRKKRKEIEAQQQAERVKQQQDQLNAMPNQFANGVQQQPNQIVPRL